MVHKEESLPLHETFPDEQLLVVGAATPWYTDIVNYLATKRLPADLTKAKQDKMRSNTKYYIWDDPYLWKHCSDQVLRRCVPKTESISIITFCHSYACRGHFRPKRTTLKVLLLGFYWPSLFKDAYLFCKTYDHCQRSGNLSPHNQIPHTPILIIEIFDVWGIDFMRPFPSSFDNL